MPAEPTTEWEKIHADAPVFDLHIHPAMNRLAIKQNLNIRHIVSRSFNLFESCRHNLHIDFCVPKAWVIAEYCQIA